MVVTFDDEPADDGVLTDFEISSGDSVFFGAPNGGGIDSILSNDSNIDDVFLKGSSAMGLSVDDLSVDSFDSILSGQGDAGGLFASSFNNGGASYGNKAFDSVFSDGVSYDEFLKDAPDYSLEGDKIAESSVEVDPHPKKEFASIVSDFLDDDEEDEQEDDSEKSGLVIEKGDSSMKAFSSLLSKFIDDDETDPEEDNRKKAEEDKRKKSEEDKRKKAEEDKRRKAEEDKRRKAEEDKRKKAEEEEARRKAEEKARRDVEEELRRKEEEKAARKAREEALREQARRKAEEEELRDAADSVKSFNEYEVGKIVELGSYPKDKRKFGRRRDARGNMRFDVSNGKDEFVDAPVSWRIIDIKKDGRALLFSEYAIDCRSYNDDLEEVTWENCSLRKWLNGEFYDKAFSDSDKSMIIEADVRNPYNKKYGVRGGNNTKDNVFCLSLDESLRYFGSNEDRVVEPTEYAKSHGAWADTITNKVWYWLRSPGFKADQAACTGSSGDVYDGGDRVDNESYAVCPAVWISLV